jgi:glycosyltransferase involved in cell wall biosynthesis
MRVAIVNRHLGDGVGGSELQCDRIARGLIERGHDVLYVVASDGIGLLDDLPYAAVRAGGETSHQLHHSLAWRPDVIYWRLNRFGATAFARGCRSAGIPFVFAASSNDDLARWPQERWPGPGGLSLRDHLSEARRRLQFRREFAVMGAVDVLTVQRQDFLGRAPVDRQAVVRSLVDPRLRRFSWPRPYVAWVGTFKRRKRPELLLRLAPRLAEVGVDLLVAGDVRDEVYRNLFGDGRSPENLHHLGLLDQPDVNGLLAGARCAVLTMEEEGFSNVLLHSWWHGTPTVSLEHDPDALIAREDIGCAAMGDVERLITSVLRYATDPVLASEAGERARRFARSEFDPVTNLARLEDVLRDAVSRAGGSVADR